MPNPHTFRKTERLCSRKHIEALFAGGSRSLSAYPLRAVFMSPEETCACTAADEPVQVLVSVSKRHFKHAVDRNRVKRLIREAFRLNKSLLTDQLGDLRLDLAFIWMSDEITDFPTVENRMKSILQRIGEKVNGRDSE